MSHDEVHVLPVRTYVAIFCALMVLTALTVWVAFQDFGALNTILALGIACFKATLVVLWFMHVKYATNLTRLVVAGSIFWFFILVAFTLSDYWTRGWIAG